MNILTQLAQKLNAEELNIPPVTGDALFINGLNIAYFVAGIVAVIVIVISGFTFVTSGGNAEAVGKAKNAILYSVIGLVVIATAFVITQFVVGRF